ncbi:hypothetical protein [Streptomyces fagopyri]|uniref:hypothetical protein n=1 Tax=Streptomyces fagopyri TaxID=2662397 RepID=UPI0033CBC075
MRRVPQSIDGDALDMAIGSWLSAMTATVLVTAQREVDGETNRITVFRPMLAELDLPIPR